MGSIRTGTALALLLVVAACSGEAADGTTTTPSPTTPGIEATTTTRPRLVDGGLVPINPATLVPEPGAEPILVADSHWGVVSPNRRFAGVESWNAVAESTPLSILDLDTYAMLNSTETEFGAGWLKVTDDATAYWVRGGNNMELLELSPEEDIPAVVHEEFPDGFFASDGFEIVGPTTFGFFGVSSVDGRYAGEASIVIVDISNGSQTQIPLPNVKAGVIEEGEPIGSVPVFVTADPAAVWDLDSGRVLIVEATRDVVTEVDPTTGEITEHHWDRPTAFLDGLLTWLVPPARAKGLDSGVNRDAVLSADGQSLYVATSVGELTENQTVWAPLDLIVLDTETWDATVMDAKVDTLFPGPNGTYLLAQGAESTQGLDSFTLRASPIYVIDMGSAELLIGFQSSDSYRTDVSFSNDGAEAYLNFWTGNETKIDMLDLGLMQLTGSVAFRELSLIGEAGLLAFHLDQ